MASRSISSSVCNRLWEISVHHNLRTDLSTFLITQRKQMSRLRVVFSCRIIGPLA